MPSYEKENFDVELLGVRIRLTTVDEEPDRLPPKCSDRVYLQGQDESEMILNSVPDLIERLSDNKVELAEFANANPRVAAVVLATLMSVKHVVGPDEANNELLARVCGLDSLDYPSAAVVDGFLVFVGVRMDEDGRASAVRILADVSTGQCSETTIELASLTRVQLRRRANRYVR